MMRVLFKLLLFLSCTLGASAQATYYLSATGSDSANGLTTGTAWLTPNHALSCGDVILAQPSTAYSYANFTNGKWGAVSCAGKNNVAWLKCSTFDACKISIPATNTRADCMDVSASYWGVQGWECSNLSTNTSSNACFNIFSPSGVIHHIIFANNVANVCPESGLGAGVNGSYGVDYIAIVGNIAYNASGQNPDCGSGIGIFEPIALDSLPGTHIYVGGNFSWSNINPSGVGCYDGNGIIFDTFDARTSPQVTSQYTQQAVIDNNITLANGGVGVRVEYNNALPNNPAYAPTQPHAPIYVRHNTSWGNSIDSSQYGSQDCGEFQIFNTQTTSLTQNLAVTRQPGCYGDAANPQPAYGAKNEDGTSSATQNWGYAVSGGANSQVYNSSGFTPASTFVFGSNTFGTDPQLASPAVPGAPNCSSYASVPTCMATVIANFTPQNSAAAGYGYQPVGSPKYDALFPQWLCTTTNMPAVVTMGCSSTWYGVNGGGTLYHATRNPSGQCDGKHNATYASVGGTGTNQPCAFGDLEDLWNPAGVYTTSPFQTSDWLIASGDTIILDSSAQWRQGWRNATDDYDGATGRRWGVHGAAYQSTNPPFPAGTSGQHTRLLGSNYASCSTGGQVDKTRVTQLFGGFNVFPVLNLSGAQNVDIQCIEITDHSNCINVGSPLPSGVSGCSTSSPYTDFAKTGIYEDTGTANVLLQDMWIHGMAKQAIQGPLGGTMTAERVLLQFNGFTTWDFDDGYGTHSLPQALWRFYDSTIEFAGCDEEYPIVDPTPITRCFGQSNGAVVADGVGTPGGPLNVDVQRSKFRYNTQEGVDLLHIDSGSSTFNFVDSLVYGNSGQSLKIGGGVTTANVNGNLLMSNCVRLGSPISGAPSGFNTNLGDFCRASDGLKLVLQPGATFNIANNTIVTTSPTTVDTGCANQSNDCHASTLKMQNNIFLGYDDPATYSLGGQSGGPGGFYLNPAGGDGTTNGDPLGTLVLDKNVFYHFRNYTANAATGVATTETNTTNIQGDPLLIGEPSGQGGSFVASQLDSFAFGITTSSPAKYAGSAITGYSSDYLGNAYHSPPSVGAAEFGSSPSSDALPPPPAGVAPTVTTNPSNQTVTAGSTATFASGASGTPTPTVQWYRIAPGGSSGVLISGATSSSYTTGALSSADNGTGFYAVYTNSQGSATTNTATLAVTTPAPTLTGITVAPASSSLATGGTVNLIATAHYTGAPDAVVAASWTSSNTAVATVTATGSGTSAYGAVVATGTGSATMTATYSGQTATAGITVTASITVSTTITNSVTMTGVTIR